MSTLIPYCTEGGTQELKVRNRGGCKNHNKYFFSHLHHLFFIQLLQPKYTNFQRGSCGISQMFRVLIPSFYITNPNTQIRPSFFGFIFYFPISFGNNKMRWHFLFDLYELSQSNGLVLTFLPLQKKWRLHSGKIDQMLVHL